MIKGLYTSASAMLSTRKKLDIVSNNLANADTVAYKKEGTVKESFPEILLNRIEGDKKEEIGSLGTGVRLKKSYTDFAPGELKKTGNSLDLAIKGEGFFVVETPQGRRYSKSGDFRLDEMGQIVTQQGYSVLNEEGDPLQTIDGREIRFEGNGQLHLGELEAGSVQIVDFADRENLIKEGENLYRAAGENVEELEADNYQVLQGYLEGSNVNIVRQMTNMIEANRLYQMNQKAVKTFDTTLGKAVNEVGKL